MIELSCLFTFILARYLVKRQKKRVLEHAASPEAAGLTSNNPRGRQYSAATSGTGASGSEYSERSGSDSYDEEDDLI